MRYAFPLLRRRLIGVERTHASRIFRGIFCVRQIPILPQQMYALDDSAQALRILRRAELSDAVPQLNEPHPSRLARLRIIGGSVRRAVTKYAIAFLRDIAKAISRRTMSPRLKSWFANTPFRPLLNQELRTLNHLRGKF